MKTNSCEVAVIGAGPAASIAAFCLAKKGVDVAQFIGAPSQRRQPDEILTPQARMLLQRLGLGAAADIGIPCRGVLRRWESEEPEFSDYAFFSLQDGRSFDRRVLHSVLRHAAAKAGAVQISAKAMRLDSGEIGWQTDEGRLRTTSAGSIFIATGRATASIFRTPRARWDRLVALALPWRPFKPCDILLVEAVKDGWWYAPPAPSDHGFVVFVTGPRRLKRLATDRNRLLMSSFAELALINEYGRPDFTHPPVGMDGHSGCALAPVSGKMVAIGDAAISLDPLSGSGVQFAVEGAWTAVTDYLSHGFAFDMYGTWLNTLAERQRLERIQSYNAAASRFPEMPFWAELGSSVELQHLTVLSGNGS